MKVCKLCGAVPVSGRRHYCDRCRDARQREVLRSAQARYRSRKRENVLLRECVSCGAVLDGKAWKYCPGCAEDAIEINAMVVRIRKCLMALPMADRRMAYKTLCDECPDLVERIFGGIPWE